MIPKNSLKINQKNITANMVEATNTSHDVKISLDLTSQGKSPIFKRVLASDYQTLIAAANKLAAKHEISP